jgi:hypothetical protein
MYVTDCLAYTDIIAELRQNEETFMLSLKAPHDIDIHLTLNYTQVKVLAEGLLALVNQASIKELLETPYDHILGDITVKLDLLEANEVDNKEGEEERCQPHILSAQTEERSLSETA